MSPPRNSKCVNEKSNTNNANKRGCKKQEEMIVPPSDDLNNFLNNTNTSQSISTRPKRTYNKK